MIAGLFFAAALALPHHEEIAPGVHAVGFAAKAGSQNCGFVVIGGETLLIGMPRGADAAEYLKFVERTTGKPVRKDQAAAPAGVRYLSYPGGTAVWIPEKRVLFGGPLVVHGPRKHLETMDTEALAAALRELEKLAPERVVPGSGTWGDRQVLTRHRKFVTELRRQVGYFIAQDLPHEGLLKAIRMPPEYQAWMPYDDPQPAEIEHVYRELTAPRLPEPRDGKPHALVLIGDQPHEPGHLEEGLRPAFEATGVTPHFIVDVTGLHAANLAKVQLLVILRDGLMRPNRTWMTAEQERAIVSFVENGKAFLNLHNSMGLYPADGPYLNLVAGRYIGHGPLERFRVEVVDPHHPITRGVKDFFVADEQHTPPYDGKRAHLLLRNRSDDGKAVAAAGWAYEPGRGRLCHLANGHTRESLDHPMVQLLLRNAINWCLRRE